MNGVQDEGPPIRQSFISARQRAFQNEFAHRAMRNGSRGLQCALGIARKP